MNQTFLVDFSIINTASFSSFCRIVSTITWENFTSIRYVYCYDLANEMAREYDAFVMLAVTKISRGFLLFGIFSSFRGIPKCSFLMRIPLYLVFVAAHVFFLHKLRLHEAMVPDKRIWKGAIDAAVYVRWCGRDTSARDSRERCAARFARCDVKMSLMVVGGRWRSSKREITIVVWAARCSTQTSSI